MDNKSNRDRSAASPVPAVEACEPEVRRWLHPIPQTGGAPQTGGPALPEATLHYICCALSYQNELLSEIKTLLEQLCGGASENSPPGDQAPE